MPDIDEAFRAHQRKEFLPPEQRSLAGLDAPLPVGFNQTNSQPSTVRRMLDWLGVQPGQKVLDVGSGSGWTTALLAHLVGEAGMVYAVEKVPELVVFGRENCRKQGVENVSFHAAGDEPGLPEHAPYDRILVSAAAPQLPEGLLTQLVKDGRLVIPVKDSIYVLDKHKDGSHSIREYPGYAFVPLV